MMLRTRLLSLAPLLVLGCSTAAPPDVDDDPVDEFFLDQAGERLTSTTTVDGTSPSAPLSTCRTIRRGSLFGNVEDTTFMPFYPTMALGSSDTLSVTGLLPMASSSNARALLRFTFAPGTIPDGATIRSAELTLTPTPGSGASGVLTVSRLTAPFVENPKNGEVFPIATGISPVVLRSVPLTGEPKVRIDLTQAVIEWQSGATANHGITLGSGGAAGFTFSSSSSEASASAAPALTVCFDPSPCTGKGNGTACDDARACRVGGVCQAGVCTGGKAAAAGVVCRVASGPCDAPETCDGAALKCPDARLEPLGKACRASVGACDRTESCNGAAAGCPTDRFEAASVVCRATNGSCDVAETCTGTSAQCPADGFATAGIVCRAKSGSCDVAEACTGTSPSCPGDGVASAGTLCRPIAGDCDLAETCTGSSKSCPTDGFKSASTVCRVAGNACQIAATCTGGSASCPSNASVPNGTTCGASMQCAGGACTACGDAYQPCCGASACPGSNASQPLTCKNQGGPLAKCMPCGKSGQACCFDTYGCDGNLACNSGVCGDAKSYP